jgi:peroxiredoxin Q/BCP
MACVEEGSQAPDFELLDQYGRPFKLSSARGRYVVLYFYPKAMTRGCTIEAIEFRDSYKRISDLGALVVGVSRDGVDDIRRFTERYSLPFTLLSDPEGRVIKLYCVQGPFGIARRITFLIDDRGIVRRKWGKVNPLGHAAEVIRAIEELRGG